MAYRLIQDRQHGNTEIAKGESLEELIEKAAEMEGLA